MILHVQRCIALDKSDMVLSFSYHHIIVCHAKSGVRDLSAIPMYSMLLDANAQRHVLLVGCGLIIEYNLPT